MGVAKCTPHRPGLVLSSNSRSLAAIAHQRGADRAPISRVCTAGIILRERPPRNPSPKGESPMMTRITLALALVFAALATVPASAQPRGHYDNERTCGYQTFQYDSSGTTTGPYCD